MQVVPETGEHAVAFTIVNRGRQTCLLIGYAAVRLSDRRGPLPFVYAEGGGAYVTTEMPTIVRLKPGARTHFVVAKYRCDGRIARTATAIRIWLPGVAGSLTRRLERPVADLSYCARYPGDEPVDPGNYVVVSPIGQGFP